jgi:hypothetical protein
MQRKLRSRVAIGMLLAALVATSPSYAAYQWTISTITILTTYTTTSNGDVILQVAAPAANCGGGFWLRRSDVGFKDVLANLIAAYHTRARVQFGFYDNEIWSGSGSSFCRLNDVSVVP